MLGLLLHGLPHGHSHGGGGGGHEDHRGHINVRAAAIHVLGDLIQVQASHQGRVIVLEGESDSSMCTESAQEAPRNITVSTVHQTRLGETSKTVQILL